MAISSRVDFFGSASQQLARLVHRAALAGMIAIAVYAAVSPVSAEPAPPTASASASADVIDANALVIRYLAAWNERDPRRRRDLIAKTWTETGSYTDAHRRGEGYAALDDMIKTAQDHFVGYQLHLTSSIEAHHGFIRFSWSAGGTPDAPLYLAGTDIFLVASDGRLQQVIGFVDATPAPAAARR